VPAPASQVLEDAGCPRVGGDPLRTFSIELDDGELERVSPSLRLDGIQPAAAPLTEASGAAIEPKHWDIGRYRLSFERPLIIGVLNITPDSFYDGGRYFDLPVAVARGEEILAEGANIVEVGGVRAGPGPTVPTSEELARVIPVIHALGDRVNIPIAVDTFDPLVAKAALEAGATIVNDINGLRNPAMRAVVRETAAGAVIMHIQGRPRVHQPHPHYDTVIGDIAQFFKDQIEVARSEGIHEERLAIDPGPGFGKLPSHDLEIVRRLGELQGFGRPVMLAGSRKAFIGRVLDGARPSDRLEGSLAVAAYAVLNRVQLIRTHDVAETQRMIETLEALSVQTSAA